MKKNHLLIAVFSIALLAFVGAGCPDKQAEPDKIPAPPVPPTSDLPVVAPPLPVADSDGIEQVLPPPIEEGGETPPTEPIDLPTPSVQSFSITARQWDFSPSTITVSEGDTVRLSITSIDVAHGFALSEFGVSERLEPNQTVNIEFVADQKGSFTFSCNVLCGSGHSGMRGLLIVE